MEASVLAFFPAMMIRFPLGMLVSYIGYPDLSVFPTPEPAHVILA